MKMFEKGKLPVIDFILCNLTQPWLKWILGYLHLLFAWFVTYCP